MCLPVGTMDADKETLVDADKETLVDADKET
jgi:hypothetical protein